MKRTAAILAIVVMVFLLRASDVRGGNALIPAGKTTGGGVTATIVTDVTNGNCAFFQIGVDGSGDPVFTSICKGLTSIRVQKAGTSEAVIFRSSYVAELVDECISAPLDLKGTTANRFTGLIDGLIDTPEVLNSLLQRFGNPSKAAITAQDYVACTTVDYGGGVARKMLSFTAVIQFQP
jgi:hypothetical protein